MKGDVYRKRIPFLLLSLIFFHILNNLIWLLRDTTYLLYDANQHFLLSLAVFEEIKQNTIPFLWRVLDRLISYRWHGVLVAYITAPFYFITGASQDAGVMLNGGIFMTVLILSTYGIGKYLCDKRTGLLAAFLVSMYPLVFNHSRIYLLDLPLTALVSLSVYFLIKSQLFSVRKYSILFCLSSAGGLLIKFINFAGVLVGPFVYVVYKGFRKSGQKLRKFSFVAVIVGAIALIIMPFLILKGYEVFARFHFCSWFNPSYSEPHPSFLAVARQWLVTSLKFFPYALERIVNKALYPLFSVIFLISIFFFQVAKIRRTEKNIINFWIFTTFFLLASFFYLPEDIRYCMPIFPAMAITSSVFVMSVKNKICRRLLIAVIVSFGLVQYIAVSYNWSFIPENISINLGGNRNMLFDKINILKKGGSLSRNSENRSSFPSKSAYPSKGILRIISENDTEKKPYSRNIFFISPTAGTYEPISCLSRINKHPFYVTFISLSEETSHEEISSVDSLINAADYVVVLENISEGLLESITDMEKVKSKFRIARKVFFNESMDDFYLIGKVPFRENNRFLVFKRNKEPINIQRKNISLYFREGVAKLLFAKNPLLASSGINGQFRYGGGYFFTAEASWSVIDKKQNSFTAVASWKDVPFKQKWIFKIKDNQDLRIDLEFLAEEEVILSYPSAAIILPHFYKNWQKNKSKGNFFAEKILRYTYKEFSPYNSSPLIITSPYERLPRLKTVVSSGENKIKNILKFNKRLRWMKFISKDEYISLPKGKSNFLSLNVSFNN